MKSTTVCAEGVDLVAVKEEIIKKEKTATENQQNGKIKNIQDSFVERRDGKLCLIRRIDFDD